MKVIKVTKVYNTLEELNNSEEFKNLWKGFHMEKEKDYDDLKVVKSFVAEDGTLYTLRRITRGKEEGLQLLNKVSIHTMLTNSPFMLGSVMPGEREIYINDERHYSRCKENRVIFAKRCKEFDFSFVTTTY